MTFTSDIPVSGDTLGSTRDRVRNNFQQIALVNAVNHIAFNTVDKGKHKFLQMPIQSTDPTTLSNENGFYSKLGTNPAEPNLFVRGQTNGFVYQLTRLNQANSGTFGNSTNYPPAVANQNGGWTFLPGGLLFQYGTMLFISGSTTSVVFPIQFSNLFSLTYSTKTLTSSRISSETGSGFDIVLSSSQNGVRFYWQAIGN